MMVLWWSLFGCTASMSSRIYEILPQRIQQWQQSPCVAEEMGRRQLERIRKEQQAARLRLTLMEKRFHELEAIIANAKQQQVQQHEEVGGEPSRQSAFCLSAPVLAACLTWRSVSSVCRWRRATATTPTCRSSVSPAVTRSIPRWRWDTWRGATPRLVSRMWRDSRLHLSHKDSVCLSVWLIDWLSLQQYESQTSFGSMYPTRIEGWDYLSVCLPACMSVCLPSDWHLSVCHCVCLPFCQWLISSSFCLSVCLSLV